jgi:hypothetical protein
VNALHTFLAAGNVQARPILGDTFEFGSQDDLVGFFSPIDEKTAFELGGTMEDFDRSVVVGRELFDAGNLPTAEATFTFEGILWQIRALKTDASAYLLGLKAIDPAP